MNVARTLTEIAPSLRWHVGRVATAILYRPAFSRIGASSVIVRPLRLRGVERISIGDNCAIYERVWLEAEPGSSLQIGDGVYLGHDVHLHAVDSVTIGSGTMIADGALVNSGRHDNLDAMAVQGTGPIRIGANCFIGQRAMVLGGVTIGDGAVIGAGAVVTRDIPAGTTAAGVPARVLPANGRGQ